jgi:hypothetical protein
MRVDGLKEKGEIISNPQPLGNYRLELLIDYLSVKDENLECDMAYEPAPF